MSRFVKSASFWLQQEPILCSMFLHGYADALHALEHPEILTHLPPWEGKRVLDLACGIGRFTGEFAKTAEQVTAVDFNPDFIRTNQEIHAARNNIRYLVSDVAALDLPERSFDLVFMNSLFMYLEDAEIPPLLEKAARWLKAGGSLFFRESCAPVRQMSARTGYFALYRTMGEYPRFFDARWILQRQGNLLAFEEICADPFKCFWLYKLRSC